MIWRLLRHGPFIWLHRARMWVCWNRGHRVYYPVNEVECYTCDYRKAWDRAVSAVQDGDAQG